MRWFVYILECKDKSLYTGITTSYTRRVKEHNSKLGAKSLLGKLPVRLIYYEVFTSQTEAAKREREIKGWRRQRKLELLESKRARVYPECNEEVHPEEFTLKGR